jgi:CTP:molybdopterin cytidylyltransferase MocA
MPAAERRARPFLSGIILAAGAARRMGRPKLLLPLEGGCVLQHVVDAAAGSCLDEVVVVLGAQAEAVRAALALPAERPLCVTVNDRWAEGQSTSLHAGLAALDARADAAAILLGDQPGIDSALIDAVAAAFVAAGAAAARPVYRSETGQRIPGHPVFLHRRLWPALETLRGDAGARTVLAEHPEWVLDVPVAGPPPVDIDTPADYERMVHGW